MPTKEEIQFLRARENMVRHLKGLGYLASKDIERALMAVPRERFVPEDLRRHAYEDRPLPIPSGQTISAPSMVAIMLGASDLHIGLHVLEIGTGSGYNAALLAELVGRENVVTVERSEELAAFSKANLAACGYDLKIVVGNGVEGVPEDAPFDRIVITAGTRSLYPAWEDQCKVGGLIVAPIGDSDLNQVLTICKKQPDGTMDMRKDVACSFVPLVGGD